MHIDSGALYMHSVFATPGCIDRARTYDLGLRRRLSWSNSVSARVWRSDRAEPAVAAPMPHISSSLCVAAKVSRLVQVDTADFDVLRRYSCLRSVSARIYRVDLVEPTDFGWNHRLRPPPDRVRHDWMRGSLPTRRQHVWICLDMFGYFGYPNIPPRICLDGAFVHPNISGVCLDMVWAHPNTHARVFG